MKTTARIIDWYRKNKRDLPWRNTKKPYHIWVSEVILQQTRVDQGMSYYLRFIKKFPTVKRLAAAPETEVLKLWQGLGYYSRARNMHAAAKEIAKNYRGLFPNQYEEIRSLKGIGDYTAAAIASFAFDLKYPVLDGNVFRLLSRYFGIDTEIHSARGKKEFLSIAGELMADYPPAEFNQAIMEFGALQCKPASPDCSVCPLQSSCYAFENSTINDFPVKKKKQISRDRFFYYLVIRDNNSIYFQQRKKKDIWLNLYEFPLIETKTKLKETGLLKSEEWKKIFKNNIVKIQHISDERKHILSHQNLYTRFIELKITDKQFNVPANWEKVGKQRMKKYAVPRIIDKYLQEVNEKYS